MSRPRWPLLLTLVALGALLFGACGGDDDDDDDGGGGGVTATPTATSAGGDAGGAGGGEAITVTLSEWAVEPEVASVGAGEITFTALNEGSVAHEFVIIRSDLAADALPVESGIVPETDVDLVAEIEQFPAGTSERLTVDLEAGSYLLICNIVGHYDLGMRVAFTVN